MHDFFLPVIPDECLRDQFAYKITGSTSALVYLTDTVGRLLESNRYVRCVMIDFSKAFDTVNHEVLVRKLQQFALPGNNLKWIASSLLDRSQSTKVNGECSLPINITRSIVQGSVTGPYAFIAYASDCKVLGILNFLMKYADDFNLLVPENSDVPVVKI